MLSVAEFLIEMAEIQKQEDFGTGGIQETEGNAVIQKTTTPLETVTTETLLEDQLSMQSKDFQNPKVPLSWATQEPGKWQRPKASPH